MKTNHQNKQVYVWKRAGVLKILLLLSLFLLPGLGCDSDPEGTPNANAGDDQEVLTTDEVQLDGKASTGVSNAVWTLQSKPTPSTATLSNDKGLNPKFTADQPGEYKLELSINDGASKDTITVTAKNVLALITNGSGSDIATRERFGVTENVIDLTQNGGVLSASTSRVMSGRTIASYSWAQSSGPLATITSDTASADFAFNAPSLKEILTASDAYKLQPLPISKDDTSMWYRLTVTDDLGATDSTSYLVYLQDAGSEMRTSSGLFNVALGTTVYLSGPSQKAKGAAPGFDEVPDWSWTLIPPSGSSATFADTGTVNSMLQFPKFVPDKTGTFSVNFTSTVADPGTLSIHVAEFVGVGTIAGATPMNPECGTCHNGGAQPDKVTPWLGTKHSMLFSDNLGTYLGQAPEPFNWQFHTVGYDTSAANGGFDDSVPGSFPISNEDTFDTFAAAFPKLASLSGVQCESCHGPGSLHSGDPLAIGMSVSQSGVCGQCHVQERQWKNSAHNSTGVVHGRGTYQTSTWLGTGCQRCHAGKGFVNFLKGGQNSLTTLSMPEDFVGVTCAACHDPHDATNPAQLRAFGEVTMVMDGSTVNAGRSAVCYKCHDGVYRSGLVSCDTDRNGISNTSDDVPAEGVVDGVCLTGAHMADYNSRQVHYNPQAPILEGKGVLTDLNKDGTPDFTLTENSFHSTAGFTLAGVTGDSTLSSENTKCITCHFASGASAEEDNFNTLGGHAFKLREGHSFGHIGGEEEAPADVPTFPGDGENVRACTPCHLTLTTYNRPARADYDGDGVTEGIQDEVRGLLLLVTGVVKAADVANVDAASGTTNVGPCVAETKTCTTQFDGHDVSCSNDNACIVAEPIGWVGGAGFNATTDTVRRAAWNHNLFARGGSLGVHNAAMTVQALQKTYKVVAGVDVPNATLR